MSAPDFDSARRYVVGRLSSELPPAIRYHTLAHTEDGVAPAAERLAAMSGVQGVPLILLLTGAYFHDLGLVEQQSNHEDIGVRIAREVLPGFHYEPAQIDTIGGLIMATKLPQSPHNLLEQLLADADLDVLGKPDFLDWNRRLRAELEAFGREISDEQWLTGQIRFLREHHYWTSAARSLRNAQKEINLQALETQLTLVQSNAYR
jgi:uncharacterized protein